MKEANQHWDSLHEQPLSKKSINDLFENKIPAIRIKGFATADECNALVTKAKHVGFDYYKNVNPPIGRIGVTQFEHKELKNEYFYCSSNSNKVLNDIMEKSFNPIRRIQGTISKLGADFSLNLAEEKNSNYFAGLIRQINMALLHVDFAPLDAPRWIIGGVENQIAWNIYLKSPKNGGECVVYNKPWVMDDEKLKLENSYGYADSLVEHCQRLKIKPVLGDLVFHNTRNYHEVLNGVGERLTMSSFIGKFPKDNKLIMWS